MTAGTGTPRWVRALRVVSVLLGIAALLRDGARALTARTAAGLRGPADRMRDGGRGQPLGSS
ncbi:hypothetical protein [Nocardia blacklockiae]|uniref:hypothetical protein n=1 Tax=Nocardia blacklockiae TaxID=480036 RepID=UPI0018933617|nr:hypothetical protein [Nocardia blacklockiae]MBF6176758.1 hypothetical protein [Nocardia blacklockiae]